jgi:hypothetical protein
VTRRGALSSVHANVGVRGRRAVVEWVPSAAAVQGSRIVPQCVCVWHRYLRVAVEVDCRVQRSGIETDQCFCSVLMLARATMW